MDEGMMRAWVALAMDAGLSVGEGIGRAHV